MGLPKSGRAQRQGVPGGGGEGGGRGENGTPCLIKKGPFMHFFFTIKNINIKNINIKN